MIARATALALSLLLVLPCRAQEQPDENAVSPETRAARAHYRAGQAYYREGELKRAIEEFQASRHDDPRPELDYNLGLVYEKLGDAARAVDAWRAFLLARPEAPEKAKLEERIAALEGHVGELVVSCPVDASITIDDRGVAPNVPLRLTAGSYSVVASKDGFFTTRATAQVIGRQRVVVEIAPRPPSSGLSRRTKLGLGIGLGVGGVVLAAVGIGLGVYFGTRTPAPIDPRGGAGVVSVEPAGAK